MARKRTLRPVQYGAPTDKCAVTVRLGIEKGIFAAEGPDLSVRVIFGGPEIAAARRAVERELPHFELDCQIDMPGLQSAADLQYALGGIENPIRAEDLVDLRFLPNRPG